VPPVTRSIPVGLAVAVGAVLETVFGLLRLDAEPPMTRFLAHELAMAHWFDVSAARRDLGYVPKVSIDEGLQRLAAWLKSAGASSGGGH
jgi:nucleoside-diphosphate-sugar epimerase